jgi:hypothetical protein
MKVGDVVDEIAEMDTRSRIIEQILGMVTEETSVDPGQGSWAMYNSDDVAWVMNHLRDGQAELQLAASKLKNLQVVRSRGRKRK